MADDTPNHDLNVYDSGDQNWTHSPDMETIEERLVVRDAESNLDSYEPHAGATFVATDTGAVYDGDGSSWTAAARQMEDLVAGDVTVEDSVTWPDGTTTTSSPSGAGGSSAVQEAFAGVVYVRPDGEYVAESFVTKNGPFTDENDAGAVIQALHDDIKDDNPQNIRGNPTIGKILVDRGVYEFGSRVTITAPGLTLVGASDYEWGKDGPTKFVPDGLPDRHGFLRVEANACAIQNIAMNLRNRNVYGIHIWDSDRHNLRHLIIENVGPNGEGLRVSGSYQSTIEQCQIRQAHFRINQESGKNPNNTIIDKCLFQHTHGSAPPIKFAGNGNEIHGCRINQGDATHADSDVSALQASTSGPSKGWEFYNCKIFGSDSGGPMIQGRRLKFNGCSFGGGGDAVFEKLSHTTVQNCEFNVNYQVIKLDGSNNQFEGTVFAGNYVGACREGGNAAIELVSGGSARNDKFAIVANTFDDRGEYSIDIAENGMRNGLITGNYLHNGLNESWGGDAYNVLITNNWGYNPVGYDRDTPQTPNGTGESNKVGNYWGQPAVVRHTGHASAHVVLRDGTDHAIAPDTPSVELPPFAKIYYEDGVPDGWQWYWR